MHPVLFEIGPVTVYSYGLFAAIGVLTAFVLSARLAPRYGLDPLHATDLVFLLFITGIAGSRALYVFQNPLEFRASPWSALDIRSGGLVWYGGFIFSAACGIVYARWRRWPLLRLADFFSPILALVHGIGRVGCFLNGCCFGKPSSWGTAFAFDGVARVPVQLYEAASLIALSFLLFRVSSKPHRDGDVFVGYLFFYGFLRFFLEFLRADQRLSGPLTLPQWTSLGMMAAAAGLALLIRRPRSAR